MPEPVLHLSDWLRRAAEEHPGKLALVESGGRSLTWGQVDEEVDRVAGGLAATGLRGGQRAVLLLGNRIELVVAYLALLRLQVVAVPVNPRGSAAELAHVLADSTPRLVVADADRADRVRDVLARTAADGGAVTVVLVDGARRDGEVAFDDLRGRAPGDLPPLTDPERVAALLYTSGTTGLPRGAMLSHRALAANVEQVAAADPPMIDADDVVLGVLPLSHVYGLNAVLGGVLRQCARLVLADRFDVQETLDLIDDEACSVVPVAPPVFAHWRDVEGLRERLGPVRLLLSGSAPLDPDVAADFTARTGVAVHQGYGLTETAPVVTSTLRSAHLKPGSVGAVLDGVSLKVADTTEPEDDGGEPGDPGELWVRGPNLFSGYWPDGADGPDEDGWWPTGDVGFVDTDGDVFLVDRVTEVVIVSGFNVYPAEVEDCVCEVDGVRAAAVVGVPDPVGGEAVVAYVLAPGLDATAASRLAAEVERHCRDRLAGFKVPRRVEVVERLPLTVTGKVQKGRLRRQENRRLTEAAPR